MDFFKTQLEEDKYILPSSSTKSGMSKEGFAWKNLLPCRAADQVVPPVLHFKIKGLDQITNVVLVVSVINLASR